ncbi:hypothetical protein TRVA0_013S02036 [Trichomonascus vanleenenianus]|uniref:uncharacterized protein n=1 Tax=Trichomonascus vanleenenianus TaxID=2268995 RepID=UPI003EC9E346
MPASASTSSTAAFIATLNVSMGATTTKKDMTDMIHILRSAPLHTNISYRLAGSRLHYLLV